MDTRARTLLDEVLTLPIIDRAELVQAILESLSPDDVEPGEDELERELERRAAELRADPSAAIAWAEVQKLR